MSLFQRACVGLDQATDPSLGNPVESQTLSMAMGLVATLLSEPQVLINYIIIILYILLDYLHSNKSVLLKVLPDLSNKCQRALIS